MTRGVAWLLGTLIVLSFSVWQLFRPSSAIAELPVLYTLGGDFTLESTLGRPLSLSELHGQPVLLNFGYTGCPDVCPTALARMRDTLKEVGEEADKVQPVFVTLDHEADSLDRIEPYVQFFDPSFIGMTGTAEAIARATAPFKVYYEREPGTGEGSYTISHSSHIYLIDAVGQVRATFAEGVPIHAMASAVRQLLAEPVAETPVAETPVATKTPVADRTMERIDA